MPRLERLAVGLWMRTPAPLKRRVRSQLERLGRIDLAARELQPAGDRVGGATERLYARLSPESIDELERRLAPAEAAAWAAAGSAERKRLALAFGVHLGIPEILEPTGLRQSMPPSEVHSISRGLGAADAGGAYDLADMVVEGVQRAGGRLEAGAAALDFGCSSGRVVRVLAAAFPDLRWHGREPNAGAIAWATEHLRDINFAVSAGEPPLDLHDGALDFAFAISIWSHFAEGAALRWLEEMQRVIRPGGLLLLTAHGYNSLAFLLRRRLRSREWLASVNATLYRRGFFFEDEFRAVGDEGVGGPEWGISFFSLEWLCSRTTPQWRLAWYAPGRALDNQDLIVLQRAD
jgi:SAM-dependent methyltransferase